MSDDKVKVITEDIIYKSIIIILGMAYISIISIALQSQTNKSTLAFFVIEITIGIIMINIFVNSITIFCDIKNRIKLKRNSGI